METKICPICREAHEPRGLSFDGKGVNACGMYRSRIATMSGVCPDWLARQMAAAPDMLALLESILRAATSPPGATIGEASLCENFKVQIRALLSGMKGNSCQ